MKLPFLRQRTPPPTPPIPPQPGYEKDWKAGDRAECITGGDGGVWVRADSRCKSDGPARGQVLRVVMGYVADGTLWLVFREWPGMSYPAGHFRKLRPCSSDFREQMRSRSPVSVDGSGTKTRQPLKVPAIKEPELVP